MSNDLKLPKQLRRLYALLESGDCVSIADLHATLELREAVNSRIAQQNIGSYVIRLNRKLRDYGLVVIPGPLKRTYVLASLSKLSA